MSIPRTVFASVLSLASAGATAAEAPTGAARAHPVQLGALSGAAYGAAGEDGSRVVVTLAQPGDEAAEPVRVEAVLLPGQSLFLSAPRGPGAPPAAVAIAGGANGRLLVREGALPAAD